ncbi:MAG: glycosyltransferase [Pigmentiphaga sp.]|nr:glycosyltransferase [Pigmentiphaga sp.]
MIVFIRSYLIRTDSRLHRYFRVLEAAGLPWTAIAWDRTGVEPEDPRCTWYRQVSPVGGGWRNFGRILAWNVFAFRTLWQRRREVSVVHAVDLDGALGAALFAMLARRPLIFDAFDKYSDTRNLTGWPARVCDALERWCMRRARTVLLPDPARETQHGIAGWPSIRVIENVPADTPSAISARREGPARRPDGRLRLVYVGTLEPRHRGLEDLLATVAERPDRVELWVAGTGPLAALFADQAARLANLSFFGEVSPDRALELMGDGDIVVGLYYLTSRNHRYAAPNKYYEHLMLGRPLLTTIETPPGQRVEEGGTGWAIPEGRSAIAAWIDSLSFDEAAARGERAARHWEAEYADYVARTLTPLYLACVASPSAIAL